MPITVGRTLSNTTRDFLGTFRRELSAFANEFVGPKAIFFQHLGAGDGNRTHDIQLGKLTYVLDFSDAAEELKSHERSGVISIHRPSLKAPMAGMIKLISG
jgi:hypothetical protein